MEQGYGNDVPFSGGHIESARKFTLMNKEMSQDTAEPMESHSPKTPSEISLNTEKLLLAGDLILTSNIANI